MNPIQFVTGTDTNVGKTVFAASLLCYLRRTGIQALAMKPFCSGNRTDVIRLQRIQEMALTEEECNPFYFREPLAPWMASCPHHRNPSLREVLRRVHSVRSKCEVLVVEGIGGIMVPLGKGFTILDLISELNCDVWVVARNSLGTINHSLLTMRALVQARTRSITLVLMDQARRDTSSSSNAEALTTLLRPHPVVRFPYLGSNPIGTQSLKKNLKKVEKDLARVWGSGKFCARFLTGP